MAKKSKQKMLFITAVLSLLFMSTYTTLIPNVRAAELTAQEKGLVISKDVIGIDTTTYMTNAINYQQDSYLDVLPQENVHYELKSNDSELKILYTFINGKLHMIHVLENEGTPHLTKTSTDTLEMAESFLGNYRNYSSDSFYGQLQSTLANVEANVNSVKTIGNTKLEVATHNDCVTFKWTYTLNGIDAPDKTVALTYENGFLKLFYDSWDLYNIGSTNVNISEEFAADLAMARVKSDDETFAVKNFTATGAMVVETVFRSSLVADEARNADLLMLYPMRHVWVSLDKFYPPGNVYGFNVYVWADTGEICHIQERFTTINPPPELVATIDNATKPLIKMDSPVGTLPNSVPIGLIAALVLAIVLAGTAQIWLAKKKGFQTRRFFKAGGVLLCLLMLSILLVPIATAIATHPYGRATIWGSESTGAYRDPPGWSWRKHPNEVAEQQDTADDVASSFDWNGYNASNYQGSNGLGSEKGAILAQIEDNELNYPRVAVVDFDHGNGATELPGFPYDEFHYLFEDNYGTRNGSSYDDSGDHLHEHAVYDKDIFLATVGKTFFAFINTCNSAHVNDSGTFWGYYDDVTQGLVDGSYYKARGMPFAWSNGRKVVNMSTTQNFNTFHHMSNDGYNDPDDGEFVYIGFLGGSASLSQTVSGSWPYYHTWVKQFFAYGLIYDMTVNDALDHASASLWSGDLFYQTPLGDEDGFIASWPMYKYNETSQEWEWQEEYPEEPEKRRGWLKVYGNGEITLYQPLLTVNAYDSSSNPISANVTIDDVYMGTTGNSFRVAPGYHTVRVDSSTHTFHNFTGYPEFDNPVQVSVSSATTVTANYYANPPPQYALSISTGTGGSTTPAAGYHQYTPQRVTVTANPDAGYIFDNWVLDGGNFSENPITVTMTSNHTLEACFVVAPPYYWVSSIDSYNEYVSDPENIAGWRQDELYATLEDWGPGEQAYGQITGVMNGTASGHIYVYGSRAGLWYEEGYLSIYVSANGYSWNHVSDTLVLDGDAYWIDCGVYLSTFNYILVSAEDPEDFATFELDSVRVYPPAYYNLTISAGTGGSTNPAPGVHSYVETSQVSVTANASSGYDFDHWILDSQSAGSNPTIIVTMNANHELEAVFSEEPQLVPLEVLGRGFDFYYIETNVYIDSQWRGCTDDTFYVSPGAHTIEVDYDAGSGWTFHHFIIDEDWDYDNPTEITVSEAMTVTAEYWNGK